MEVYVHTMFIAVHTSMYYFIQVCTGILTCTFAELEMALFLQQQYCTFMEALVPGWKLYSYHPTPAQQIQQEIQGFPTGCADTTAVYGKSGSKVYDLNPWLWQFGHGKPHLGCLIVDGTKDKTVTCQLEWQK